MIHPAIMLALLATMLGAPAAPAVPAVAAGPRLPVPYLPIPLPAETAGAAGVPELPAVAARSTGQRVRNGVIGGVIGAAAGVGVCTLFSVTLFDGSGCTASGNTAFGAGGFLLGFGVGLVL
jgi:hypothetical protein